MKVSLVVFGALCVILLLRHRSAALRHWVLAVAIACAAAMPILEAALPAWTLPFAAPTAFQKYSSTEAPAVGWRVSQLRGRAGPMAARSHPARRLLSHRTCGISDRILTAVWVAGTAIGLCGSLRWNPAAQLARGARDPRDVRPLARSRRRNFQHHRLPPRHCPAAERSSVAARHVGVRAAPK